MVLLRRMLGDALRRRRRDQRRTLREVSSAARVSLGYLSEVERGQKEASSELLASICDALGVRLADILREVSDELEVAEIGAVPAVARVSPPAVHVSPPVVAVAPHTSPSPSASAPSTVVDYAA